MEHKVLAYISESCLCCFLSLKYIQTYIAWSDLCFLGHSICCPVQVSKPEDKSMVLVIY